MQTQYRALHYSALRGKKVYIRLQTNQKLIEIYLVAMKKWK